MNIKSGRHSLRSNHNEVNKGGSLDTTNLSMEMGKDIYVFEKYKKKLNEIGRITQYLKGGFAYGKVDESRDKNNLPVGSLSNSITTRANRTNNPTNNIKTRTNTMSKEDYINRVTANTNTNTNTNPNTNAIRNTITTHQNGGRASFLNSHATNGKSTTDTSESYDTANINSRSKQSRQSNPTMESTISLSEPVNKYRGGSRANYQTSTIGNSFDIPSLRQLQKAYAKNPSKFNKLLRTTDHMTTDRSNNSTLISSDNISVGSTVRNKNINSIMFTPNLTTTETGTTDTIDTDSSSSPSTVSTESESPIHFSDSNSRQQQKRKKIVKKKKN